MNVNTAENHETVANSVEKHEIVMLNVKLQVKVRFKTFYWVLELLFTNFILDAATITTWFGSRFFIS